MRYLWLILFSLLLCGTSTLHAFEVPPSQGYVTDLAQLIDTSTERKLEQYLRDFENTDSTQLVVLTIPDLDGLPVEQAALEVAEQWQIGQREHDNGVLLLVARDDRKVRIEVGMGLEGRLTDLLAGRIVDQELLPRFRQGKYSDGIVAGVFAISDAVRGEYKGNGGDKKRDRNPFGLLFFLLFVLPIFLPGRRRSLFWFGGFGGGGGRGGFGGGGFSGGGGGFGGGGASGSW
ncbi:TPM domain-containing protein [uncultured Desulfuromonas sp.]|uniref:TPM domain-containing protein n=1 Tax=uncultured Desulfuromonas sp. TaxID=181013 RepID=UPI002AABACFA|nr:TPM domain-containing protein [uncultured Desulfuromonas sp.]